MVKRRVRTNKNDEGKLESITTRLPPSLIIQMKVWCAANRMKIQQFIEEAVKEKLQKPKSKK